MRSNILGLNFQDRKQFKLADRSKSININIVLYKISVQSNSVWFLVDDCILWVINLRIICPSIVFASWFMNWIEFQTERLKMMSLTAQGGVATKPMLSPYKQGASLHQPLNAIKLATESELRARHGLKSHLWHRPDALAMQSENLRSDWTVVKRATPRMKTIIICSFIGAANGVNPMS